MEDRSAAWVIAATSTPRRRARIKPDVTGVDLAARLLPDLSGHGPQRLRAPSHQHHPSTPAGELGTQGGPQAAAAPADQHSPPFDLHPVHNIRLLREARGQTQDRMAKLAGIPRATWGHLETGSANPTLAVLDKVATSLQVLSRS